MLIDLSDPTHLSCLIIPKLRIVRFDNCSSQQPVFYFQNSAIMSLFLQNLIQSNLTKKPCLAKISRFLTRFAKISLFLSILTENYCYDQQLTHCFFLVYYESFLINPHRIASKSKFNPGTHLATNYNAFTLNKIHKIKTNLKTKLNIIIQNWLNSKLKGIYTYLIWWQRTPDRTCM